jgi:hypothetical protein
MSQREIVLPLAAQIFEIADHSIQADRPGL